MFSLRHDLLSGGHALLCKISTGRSPACIKYSDDDKRFSNVSSQRNPALVSGENRSPPSVCLWRAHTKIADDTLIRSQQHRLCVSSVHDLD